jgi:hypothetical protein|tara:strand:- start:1943 stop:2056 length:114 start_codon:yes stop_codon:yes gene_type:complete
MFLKIFNRKSFIIEEKKSRPSVLLSEALNYNPKKTNA